MKTQDSKLSEIMNFALLSERLDGDEELMRELAALYVVEYPKQLEGLRSAFDSSDLQRVQNAAHKIKGTATNFAAATAAESARALEEATEFGDGVAISKMVDRLCDELHRLHFALDQLVPAVEASRVDAKTRTEG